jgi:hypothetical protein
MSVERNKEGSVTIRGKNEAMAIARIEAVSVSRDKGKFDQWVEECAKLVKPCARTFEETEQYFLENCDALPLDPKDRRMRSFQHNTVMNFCKDKLKHQSKEFSFDMTDEEIEEWQEDQNAIREEIMNSSTEDFRLNIRGYYLPHTERNKVFYEEVPCPSERRMKHKLSVPIRVEPQDIYFFFEETTEHCQANGGGESLMNKIIVFRGVSLEDIEKRSPRFLGYITTLRDMGELPGFPKE